MFSSFNSTGSSIISKPNTIPSPTNLAGYYALAYSAYQTPNYNPTTKVWTDASPNARNIAFTTGSPTIVSSVGANGTSGTFNVVDSVGDATFPFLTSQKNNFAFFAVARHKSTLGNSVFANVGTQNLIGFWQAWSGICQGGGQFIDAVDHYSTNFFEMTYSNTGFRLNGVFKGLSGVYTLMAGFSIFNRGIAKPWQIAEIIIFDKTLPASDITNIEGMLRTKYGITTV